MTEFIDARITEDERSATDVRPAGPQWHVDIEPWLTNGIGVVDGADESVAVAIYNHIAEHIARYDPARVLAECAAKRAILALHKPIGVQGFPVWKCKGCDQSPVRWDYYEAYPCGTIRALAAVWADHPGYAEALTPVTVTVI